MHPPTARAVPGDRAPGPAACALRGQAPRPERPPERAAGASRWTPRGRHAVARDERNRETPHRASFPCCCTCFSRRFQYLVSTVPLGRRVGRSRSSYAPTSVSPVVPKKVQRQRPSASLGAKSSNSEGKLPVSSRPGRRVLMGLAFQFNFGSSQWNPVQFTELRSSPSLLIF